MASTSFSRAASSVLPAVRSTHWRNFILALIGVDTLALVGAFCTAYWLRFGVGIALKPEVTPVIQDYIQLGLLALPVWLALFAASRLYDREVLLGGTEEYMLVFNACSTGIVFILMLSFLKESLLIARAWLVMSWFFTILFVSLGRFSMRRVAYRLREQGYFIVPALIVGANDEARMLAESLQDSRYSGLEVCGLIAVGPAMDDRLSVSNSAECPILGGLSDVPALVQKRGINEIIVATTALHRTELLSLFQGLAHLRNVEIRLSSGLYEVLTTGMQVNAIGTVPLMTLNRVRLDRTEMFVKSILDYAISLMALVALAPILLFIAGAIKFDSPGPVVYRRRVMGMGGKTFDAFKFRTMHVNGEEILARYPELKGQLQRDHKLQDDPRVTRVGRFLRSASLDELPQVLNVLLGQMSLVGPRMITTDEAAEYGAMRHNLLTVKPGITGLWQVSGRSDLTYGERVRLDMFYIRNYSIWLDLQILFVQTPVAVFKREGAY
jgi:exopolysaccharide biosynthesis polyprenyl glycosylphosphotransferase